MDDISDGLETDDSATKQNEISKFVEYNPKKPKWWIHLAGRATKSQKRAIRTILDDGGLRLPYVPFGSTLDWNDVFPVTVAISNKSSDSQCQLGSHVPATATAEPKEATREIWLELGFGRGENLLALAHQYRNQPQFCLVGAEIHNPGIGVVCQRVQQAIEGNALLSGSNDTADEMPFRNGGCGYWSGYTLYSKSLDPFEGDSPIASSIKNSFNVRNPTTCPPPYSNLRVHAGDGFKLLSKLPTNTLSAILVTFPDPFPKEGEEKWRLIQVETLEQFHRVLRKRVGKYQAFADETSLPSVSPNGRFYLATDHFGYFRWVHNTMAELNAEKVYFRLLEPCPPRMSWLPAISTYEQKGWDEGRRTHLACWETL